MTQGSKSKGRSRTFSDAQPSKKLDAEKNGGVEEEKSRLWRFFKRVPLVAKALTAVLAVFTACEGIYYVSYRVHLAPAAWDYFFAATELDGQFAIMRATANPDDLRPIEAVFKQVLGGKYETKVVRKILARSENEAVLRLLKHSTDQEIIEYLKKLGL